MLNWRITALTVLSMSLAACSSQPAPQNAAAGQSTYSDDVLQSSPTPPRRPSQSNYANHNNASGAQQQPANLASAGGDKTFRGEGRLNRFPDNIANSLRLRGLAAVSYTHLDVYKRQGCRELGAKVTHPS